MRIIKFKGRTEESVKKEIEKQYPDNAIIINTQKQKKEGYFKWLRRTEVIITVAVKEEEGLEEETSKQLAALKLLQDDKKESTSLSNQQTLLMEMKEEIGILHKELIGLRKAETKKSKEQIQEFTQQSNLMKHMQSRLRHMGIQEEVCEYLFEGEVEENAEDMVRRLYERLEHILLVKPEKVMPQIIFFIGSTGVGKTTTLAKLTAKYVLEERKKVVLFTSDTYRIAAVEQLKTYADILTVPLEIIYSEKDLPKFIEKWSQVDYILIDTAGRSHKNIEQVEELKELLANVREKQVFLVLSASTSFKDVDKIVATYENAYPELDLIITKIDETDEIANIINIGFKAKRPICYLTNGQNVPEDIQLFNQHHYIEQLFERLNNE